MLGIQNEAGGGDEFPTDLGSFVRKGVFVEVSIGDPTNLDVVANGAERGVLLALNRDLEASVNDDLAGGGGTRLNAPKSTVKKREVIKVVPFDATDDQAFEVLSRIKGNSAFLADHVKADEDVGEVVVGEIVELSVENAFDAERIAMEISR